MANRAFRRFILLYICVLAALVWTGFALRPKQPQQPALEAWLLDVGQGESLLLREPSGKMLLYDGGPDSTVLQELGAVLPLWQRRLDIVVVSHNHSDHIRGLIPVLERFEVGEVWISGAIHTTDDYRAFLEHLAEKNLTPKIIYFDQASCKPEFTCPPEVDFGQAKLQAYYPLQNFTGIRPEHQHDATVVLKASYAGRAILLTGDLEEKDEQAMLEACPPASCSLASEIMQVPHHGSEYGLLPDFLQAVNPKIALIPVGAGNTYGHPGPTTLEKLRRATVQVYRTDTQGRIHALLTSEDLKVTAEKSAPP